MGGGSTGVATWELLRQAEVIVACGKVRIPRVVVRGLERAIRLRKRCAAWCRMLGTEDKISDERHLVSSCHSLQTNTLLHIELPLFPTLNILNNMV